MKRVGLALTLAVALALPGIVRAQAGVSFAVVASDTGDVFQGFLGPFRATNTTWDVNYMVLCVNGQNQSHKFVTRAIGIYPNGSTLAQVRDIATTAAVSACAAGLPEAGVAGITVPRGAVILPAIQLGQ